MPTFSVHTASACLCPGVPCQCRVLEAWRGMWSHGGVFICSPKAMIPILEVKLHTGSDSDETCQCH